MAEIEIEISGARVILAGVNIPLGLGRGSTVSGMFILDEFLPCVG